jgi:hypothetical protein
MSKILLFLCSPNFSETITKFSFQQHVAQRSNPKTVPSIARLHTSGVANLVKTLIFLYQIPPIIVVSLLIKHTHSPYFTLYRYRRRKKSKRLSPLVTFNLEIPPDKKRTTVPSKEQPRRNIFISCKSRRTSRFEICNGKSIEFNKLIGALYGFTNLSGNCGKY